MVEPNANEAIFKIDEPEDFYEKYSGTLYDWNLFYPKIITAIREVDSDTPVIVGGMGYSSIEWLPYIEPTTDKRTVYAVHQYTPYLYTHQERRMKIEYPGEYDVDWDRIEDRFGRDWIDGLFGIIDEFKRINDVPVAITEFGLMRWEPGGDKFMEDQMSLLEKRGINHALWVWDPSWRPWTEEVDAFNFRHGPDRKNHENVSESDLMNVIRKYWGMNLTKPSRFLKNP
jgi:hypothetical protein